MVLMVRVTATAVLLALPKTETVALYVPGLRPVGSAETVTADGVVPLVLSCPLTLSQLAFDDAENEIAAPVEVTLSVWLCAAPPDCAEKVRLPLSTATFCA